MVGPHRSTQRLAAPEPTDDERELRDFLRAFAKRRPRWGWRRAAKEARRGGRQVNDKRVRRLWRDEGLRVPQRRRKKRLTGIGTHVGAMCPIVPNALWALDFQFDTTDDGRTLKLLNVIDEYTRECLAIDVARSIDTDAVVAALDRIATRRGAPAFVARVPPFGGSLARLGGNDEPAPSTVPSALAGSAVTASDSSTNRAVTDDPARERSLHRDARHAASAVAKER